MLYLCDRNSGSTCSAASLHAYLRMLQYSFASLLNFLTFAAFHVFVYDIAFSFYAELFGLH